MNMAGGVSQGRPERRVWRIDWIPFAVLLVGLALSGAAALYVAAAARAKDAFRFEEQVDRSRRSIQRRIELYVASLRSAAGLFAADPNVDRRTFKAYADRLELRKNYPGIQGIGFALRVARGEEAALAQRLEREWGKPVKVWPEVTAAPERDVVLYLEPQEDERNWLAIGYDMLSHNVRRAAMERARDTARPAASGSVQLVQDRESERHPGFLIYLPVYRNGGVPPTVDDRRRDLIGFVYSPFRAQDLLEEILGGIGQRQIDFEVFDGPQAGDQTRLFRSSEPHAGAASFNDARRIDVEGRTWTLVLRTRPDFDAGSGVAVAWWVLAGGILVSGLLFVLTRSEAAARLRAESAAAELERSRQHLLVSLDQRKAAEEARRQLLERERNARQEAEAANRIKDDFLATISHELRTPLNAMLGWAQLLQQGGLDEQGRVEAIEAIERNARSQAQLIEDLLDLSRIIRGKVQIERANLQLADVIQSAIGAVAPSAAARRIEIRRTIDKDIGPVLGDANRLQQVIWNLLSNAIKFTPEGGRIEVALERRGDFAAIRVSDNGAGIAPDFLPHVFDRFRQADASTTRQKGGLGLGLAIVQSLVQMHGGTVQAHSAGEGKGATFTVLLPRITSASAIWLPPSDDGKASDLRLSRIRVLVVDDDPDARRLVGKVLERHGAWVSTAASASEALASFDRQAPDVLLSDIGMPGEDGYALIAKVRSRDPARGGQVPAAALTAFAREEDRVRSLAAGYQMHVSKPVGSVKLVEVVAELAKGTVA
jgi:signal transduction histidine kinase/ActR/RegA family two-component response regulator